MKELKRCKLCGRKLRLRDEDVIYCSYCVSKHKHFTDTNSVKKVINKFI